MRSPMNFKWNLYSRGDKEKTGSKRSTTAVNQARMKPPPATLIGFLLLLLSLLSPLNVDSADRRAAEIRILLQTVLPESSAVEVSLSKDQIIVQPGDLFELFLKVKNRSKEPVSARIDHLIEPRELTAYVDFVECGFLVPLTLEAGKEQEYFARYLLREGFPPDVQQLRLTYDVKLRRLLRLR